VKIKNYSDTTPEEILGPYYKNTQYTTKSESLFK